TVTTALLFEEVGVSLPLTVAFALLAGIAAGLFNGLIVVNGKIVAFVATLATQGVMLAIALFLSGGQTITIAREGLQEAVFIRVFGIPSSVWIMFFCYIVGYVMLTQTKLGAHIYATGADYRAALLSGVPVDRVIRIALVISALTAALTAVLVTARAKQSAMFGLAIAGSVDFVTALTAVLLGGFSLFGGVGRIERNLVAVLFLTILGNGLQLMDVPTGIILIVRGFALVLAVILSVLRARMT
ncbi:MAG: ABC transporter permease, partial [Caldilineaceae bacterium]|nr:ABC transporter permease [Caldilineaceae bacterium]